MASKIYHIRLDDDVADRLRLEGSGKIPEGVRSIIRLLDRLPTGHTPNTRHKTLDLPDDDTPQVDGRHKVRLDREAREAAEATKKAHDAPRWQFRSRIEHAFVHRSGKRVVDEAHEMFEDVIPLDERLYIIQDVKLNAENIAEQIRVTAQYEQSAKDRRTYEDRVAAGMTQKEITAAWQKDHGIVAEAPKPQTLRLSTKALKGLGMFGTPESMTDDQIKEINADWENREAPVDFEE